MLRIHVLAGQALVWRFEDAREIRERHRLVGTLVGALARAPRQNVRLGLPLQLLPEEARLLAEMGAAVLVRSADAQPQGQSAQASEGQLYEQGLEESYQEQRCLAAQERWAQLANLAERIAQGRAHKQEQRGKLPDTVPLPGPAEERERLESAFVFPHESMMVQLPTAWPCPGQEEQVDWTQPSWDWPHAGHQEHETRYCVFRDLWGRGYYVTSGSKFGGDFLVYPGDPMRFHAHYIALCCPPGAPLPLCDIVAAARLGTSVKKTVLLCSAGEDGVVIYTSLQWSGLQ
ncbi:tRNA-splicing endonuclease subunit Sen34 [Alligator sinensis]|uniref:tRNA-splicing endonuclease subunit Sen34 n=1 Tax=Alligator sinensis TaxID=38654 RepID=A0A1U7RIL7_ALLSI|nr:tRNA-splicing endonuclease subunit Sen34 [Alligator sinensis]